MLLYPKSVSTQQLKAPKTAVVAGNQFLPIRCGKTETMGATGREEVLRFYDVL